ncbi:MAG: 2-amino-4-hydroxy-6-hydroxymethyldihydropteridine diphosphokinase [Xanthomonadales bacterium]|nr:2-amino-4-hydroxy-6-hydroxymethyldihydropteridine diphosphokinase [Xanthomonadales bacterium]
MAILRQTYFLGIGSNVNRQKNIKSALNYLACSFKSLQVSPVYQSVAFGFEGQDFYNLVVKLETVFTPHPLKDWLQNIENIHGRDRSKPRYSDRTLDIDLLLCDGLIIDDGVVQVPRTEILKRDYVLKPLQDLAPDLIHPVAQKRLAELWQALNESQVVELKLVPNDFITDNITGFG